MIGLYARAALGALPLPRPDAVPERRLAATVTPDYEHVARYVEVCSVPLREGRLPVAYPHVLAFGLALELMTDRRFPVPVLGVVHIANTITQHRPIPIGSPLDLTVRATPLEPHPKGRAFSLVTEAHVDGDLVWEEVSTNLRRGPSGVPAAERPATLDLPALERWEADAGLGRRYAAVSGDRNPIHLHDLTARAFGFPRAIAHGMWTLARALGALDLPPAFTAHAEFRRPLLLPGEPQLAAVRAGDAWQFAVRSGQTVHLEGTVTS